MSAPRTGDPDPSPRPRSADRFGARRGVVLPIALLLVLALGVLAGSVLAFARGELLLERGNVGYLERRARSEAELRALYREPTDRPTPGRIALPAGFVLLRPVVGSGPSAMGVGFVFDPDSVARALPALQVEGSAPTSGVAWAGESCPGYRGSGPAVRVRPPPTGPPADPPLPDPPRLGPFGLEELAALGAVELPARGPLPAAGSAGLYLAPAGARYDSGEGFGLLLAAGDLAIEGDAVFRGVVLTVGDLRLEGVARVEGAALVGGTARLGPAAEVVGCAPLVARALALEGLVRTHSVPAGALLGRF